MGQASQRKRIFKPLEVLGLDKIDEIEPAMQRTFGTERAGEILAEWDRLSKWDDPTGRPGAQNALYEYLYGDFERGMLVARYTDAAIIREICLWIFEHRGFFGREILDVGTGNGIVCCYLANLLPGSHITAIDRSANCIRFAQQIKEKMGVSNVDFRQATPEDLEGQVFDTVLSARTFHENIGTRYTDYRFLPFSEQVKTYESIYEPYIKLLAGLTAPGSNLICIERNRIDTEFLSILEILRKRKFTVDEKSMKELQCKESDFRELSIFQTLVAQKTEDVYSAETLFRLWSERAFSKSDDPEFFTRAQADWFTEQNAKELIEGYKTFDANGTQLAKAGLYTMKNEPQKFLMYQANYGNAGVQVLPYEALEEAKEVFADHKAVDAARGFQVKEMRKTDYFDKA